MEAFGTPFSDAQDYRSSGPMTASDILRRPTQICWAQWQLSCMLWVCAEKLVELFTDSFSLSLVQAFKSMCLITICAGTETQPRWFQSCCRQPSGPHSVCLPNNDKLALSINQDTERSPSAPSYSATAGEICPVYHLDPRYWVYRKCGAFMQ